MTQYTHILVAIDFSDSASSILDKARQIAERNKARLSLLHIVEYLPPIDSAYEPILASNWTIDESQLLSRAEESLQKLCLQHDLQDAELNVALGTPKHEITQFVNEHQCDLIVMGSHGRHGISLLLGSTANAVLHEMPCDILAVKIKA
jgi:universal stress protein A